MSAPGPARRAADGGKNDWRTPPELFELLNSGFGFTVDGAASDENHLCPRYFSEDLSAFEQNPHNEVIFLNPPYEDLNRWIEQAWWWSRNCNDVVALVPAATDTRWWHNAQRLAQTTTLLAGRVRFIDPATGKPGKSNTTGSTLFHFRPERGWKMPRTIETWEWQRDLPVKIR